MQISQFQLYSRYHRPAGSRPRSLTNAYCSVNIPCNRHAVGAQNGREFNAPGRLFALQRLLPVVDSQPATRWRRIAGDRW